MARPILALAAVLALWAPALRADPPGAPPPPPAPSIPESAAPQDPAPASAPVFDDWRLDCRGSACAIETSVRSTSPGAEEVLRVQVRRTDPQGATLVVTTPLPLYLPDPLALTLGTAEPRSLPWFTCTAGTCEARLPLDPALVTALRRERAGSAVFTLVEGVRVRLGFSLMGFTAALRALETALASEANAAE